MPDHPLVILVSREFCRVCEPTESKEKAGDERRRPFHLSPKGAGSGTSLHPNVLVMELVGRLATDPKIIADQVELFAFVHRLPLSQPELCQQAAKVTISPRRTASQQVPMHAA
jgi:hypothetical protein